MIYFKAYLSSFVESIKIFSVIFFVCSLLDSYLSLYFLYLICLLSFVGPLSLIIKKIENAN